MILFIADLHIKLGQKNVPVEWAKTRYTLLFDRLKHIMNKENVTTIIHGGDIFDRAPSVEELSIFFQMLETLQDANNILYAGNHEATGKHSTFLSHLKKAVLPFNGKIIDTFEEIAPEVYILPYNELKKKHWHGSTGATLFTHVRGAVPPHVTPEIDLELFSGWNRVYAGDLHAHSNSQGNITYPGSPLTTSFHRSKQTGENGILLIEKGNYTHVDLSDLPQLIRKTVEDPNDMVPTEYDHTIYELVGNMEDLSKISNTELLDKKITRKEHEATLSLTGSIEEELVEYLLEVADVGDIESVLKEYHDSIAAATVG